MTLELSTPIKIVALAGLVLVLAVGAFASYTVLLRPTAKQSTNVVSVPTPTKTGHHTAVVPFTQSGKTAAPAAPRVEVDRNLPGPLRHTLLRSREVVAVLTAPGVPGDSDSVREARLGATAAHMSFTVLNVRQETIAASLAAWAPNAGDGSVLVVQRPGTIVAELDGYADRQMVAQAALDAR